MFRHTFSKNTGKPGTDNSKGRPPVYKDNESKTSTTKEFVSTALALTACATLVVKGYSATASIFAASLVGVVCLENPQAVKSMWKKAKDIFHRKFPEDPDKASAKRLKMATQNPNVIPFPQTPKEREQMMKRRREMRIKNKFPKYHANGM